MTTFANFCRLPVFAAAPMAFAARRATTIVLLSATLAPPLLPPSAAQQCRPAGGGSPCETADGMASLGDQDGGEVAVGNPFHPITGNKYQEEVDAPALPGFLGLEIRRHYNAAYDTQASPWGRGWSLSYDTRLFRHGSMLQIVQADGRRLLFAAPPVAGEAAAAPAQCAAAAPGQGELTVEREGYRWMWPQQREIRFDADGGLVAIGPRGGSPAESVRVERDPRGRIIRIADPQGRSLRIGYDGNGYLSRIEHPLGTWQYRVDDDGRLQSVTAPDGMTRRYRYEDAAHPARFTATTIQPPGEEEVVVAQWEYDARGRVVRHRRADGGELRMAYRLPDTASGRVEARSELTDAGGGRTRFRAVELAGRWRITEIAGAGCAECGPTNLRMRHDARGLLVARRRLGGEGIAYQRDAQGRVVRLSRLDAAGTATVDYLVRFEYADGQTGLPRLIARPSVVAGREHRILLNRDERGNLLESLESGYSPGPDGAPWRPIARKTLLRYRLIASRLVLAEVDGPLPNGPAADPADSDITRLGYDEAGRYLQKIVLPGGFWHRVLERDAAGRELVSLAGDGHREVEQRLVLDYRHRWLELRRTAWLVADAKRLPGELVVAASSRRFGPRGHLLRVQDRAGRQLSYRHDASGRLIGVADARGYRIELRRDPEGRVVAIMLFEPGSDRPRRSTYFGRSPDGRLETFLLPDGRRFALHYDAAGRPAVVAGSDGSVRLAMPPSAARASTSAGTLSDDFGRPVQQRLPDHGTRTIGYDEAGRMVQLTDAAGTTFSFRHDVAGRLLARTVTGATGEESATFDWQGALLVRAEDAVQSTRWTHDAAGRIVATSVALAGLPGPPLRTTRAWDAIHGEAIEQGLADGRSLAIGLSNASQGEAAGQLQLRSRFWSAAHDWLRRRLPGPAGNRIAELLPATTLVRRIVVHPLDGLTGITFFNGSVMSRTVDAAGRTDRLLVGPPDRPAGHWRYHYERGWHIAHVEDLLHPRPGPARLADLEQEEQRRRRDDAVAIAMDRAGRVVADDRFRYAYSVRGQLQSVTDLQGRLVASYAYNHRGQRVRKTVPSAEGTGLATRYFLWDEDGLVAEIAADGRIMAQHVAIDVGRRRIPIVQLNARVPGEVSPRDGRTPRTILAVHSEHRGAPVALTDEGGRLAWRARVGTWGTATVEKASGGVGTNLRLPGQYFDAETGLHDNWHRSYDPRRGSYLQPDPLGYPDGANAYAYAGGDPVNRSDPYGLYEIDVHYYMTFFLGVTAGLDPDEARIVALAAQYVDDNPLTSPVDAGGMGSTVASVLGNQARLLGYHFVLSGNDGRTLPQYRNDRLDLADSPQLANLLGAARTAGIGRPASLQFLGEYLHALADTYAHRDARNVPYDALILGCGVGHGLAGHEPDLTYDDLPAWGGVLPGGLTIGRTGWRREARTLAMELELHGVLLAVGDPARARDAAEIEATLREFNAIRESEGRGGDFAGKIGLLQARLAALGYGHLDLRNGELYGYNERDARSNRLVFLRDTETGKPLREEDLPGVCLEGGTRCRTR